MPKAVPLSNTTMVMLTLRPCPDIIVMFLFGGVNRARPLFRVLAHLIEGTGNRRLMLDRAEPHADIPILELRIGSCAAGLPIYD